MKRALRMFAVAAVATAALSTAGWAQNPQAVMSWGAACPTVVHDMTFVQKSTDGSVPNPYPMYIAAKNLTAADANVGSDINLFYGRGLPDAWRFDDAGCQTGSQVSLSNNGTKTCPAMKGTNPLTITNFQYYANEEPNPRMNVRLAITYDNFTPVAGTTYILWSIIFDHSFSVTGPSTPGVNCGGGELPLCIAMTDPTMPNYSDVASGVLALTGIQEPFTFATATDGYITWNGGLNCPGAVPTVPATWGRLKGMYH
ncbi:MAG TPA: hypothetical protein VGR66_00555 [Candidatus Eisenbacteria bacterium]|nr:hypothetical protein [Candidatus Eisenbacteria bacterium]